jgi:hypothetical protein
MPRTDIDKIIGKSGDQAIKLKSYGKGVSLVIGTPKIDQGHAIHLTPTLALKIVAALTKFAEERTR